MNANRFRAPKKKVVQLSSKFFCGARSFSFLLHNLFLVEQEAFPSYLPDGQAQASHSPTK